MYYLFGYVATFLAASSYAFYWEILVSSSESDSDSELVNSEALAKNFDIF
jgi:hypothetical protein